MCSEVLTVSCSSLDSFSVTLFCWLCTIYVFYCGVSGLCALLHLVLNKVSVTVRRVSQSQS